MAESQNLETKDIRTKDGNLKFGHIHKDQVKSSIILQAQGGLEYITIDQTEPRKGWITSRCRGQYRIVCGDNVPEGQVAIYINATGDKGLSLGNIDIKTNGVFRVNARDIQLNANGTDTQTGVITLKSNEEIKLDSKKININATTAMSLLSNGELNITAKSIMKIAAGTCQQMTSFSTPKQPTVPVNPETIKRATGSRPT